MNIKIYVVGDKIEKFYLEAIKEYEKRLSRYCKITLLHLKREEHLQRELNEKSHTILISTKGNTTASEELADKIDQLGVKGISDVSIIVGSSKIRYDETLTLSQMEMDFGLKTTILFEQVYRAYRILNNHPYHK